MVIAAIHSVFKSKPSTRPFGEGIEIDDRRWAAETFGPVSDERDQVELGGTPLERVAAALERGRVLLELAAEAEASDDFSRYLIDVDRADWLSRSSLVGH